MHDTCQLIAALTLNLLAIGFGIALISHAVSYRTKIILDHEMKMAWIKRRYAVPQDTTTIEAVEKEYKSDCERILKKESGMDAVHSFTGPTGTSVNKTIQGRRDIAQSWKPVSPPVPLPTATKDPVSQASGTSKTSVNGTIRDWREASQYWGEISRQWVEVSRQWIEVSQYWRDMSESWKPVSSPVPIYRATQDPGDRWKPDSSPVPFHTAIQDPAGEASGTPKAYVNRTSHDWRDISQSWKPVSSPVPSPTATQDPVGQASGN